MEIVSGILIVSACA